MFEYDEEGRMVLNMAKAPKEYKKIIFDIKNKYTAKNKPNHGKI